MNRSIFGGCWLALSLALPAAAQNSPQQDYQAKMAPVVHAVKSANIAVSCGLRDESWQVNMAETAVRLAYAEAILEWPSSDANQVSDQAQAEAKIMGQEFIDANDSGTNPTPKQCADLAASGELQNIDKLLAGEEALGGAAGN